MDLIITIRNLLKFDRPLGAAYIAAIAAAVLVVAQVI
jgi:hypothetical protein